MQDQDPSDIQDLRSIAGPAYQRTFGDVKLPKGKFNASSLFYSWDAVPYCRESNCPIFDVCTYHKAPNSKCSIHSQFLKSLSIILYRNFAHVMDEPKLYRVGLHLMPLYKMLCKLLIEEHAVEQAVYLDDKGVRRSNPVFKEIRDTLQSISKEWRALGLTGMAGVPEVPDPFEHGNPNFHASLEGEKRIRPRRGGNGDRAPASSEDDEDE